MRADLVLKRPIITEKTMTLAGTGKFTFEVDRRANKYMVAQVVAKQFKVDVVSVATVTTKGKDKKFGSKRHISRLANTKKAIVELKKGQKIDLFEVKEEK